MDDALAWLPVPERSFISVEHPCIIRNIGNAIRTLGGEELTGQLVKADDVNSSHPLYLRPGDLMSKPIMSKKTRTDNVLLKVTVPKRTGRKRKRGSTEPYVNGNSQGERSVETSGDERPPEGGASSLGPVDGEYVLQSLRDNVGRYHVEPVGQIDYTHRFRGVSDFQSFSSNGPFMQHLNDTLLTFDLEHVKNFKLDPSMGIEPGVELLPPPSLSTLPLPFNYAYLQNPAVKYTMDASGHSVLSNSQMAQRLHTQMLAHDTDKIPEGPSSDLPRLDLLEPKLRVLILTLRELLEERPLWTRRALANKLGPTGVMLKFAYQYVGYMFRSGPWREAVVKYGVDPRGDPRYRFYQTLMFQISGRKQPLDEGLAQEKANPGRSQRSKKSPDANTHIFDGRNITLDGRVWQVCDILDPLLQEMLSTEDIRTTCDVHSDGWYTAFTWSKVKAIMKDKILKLLDGHIPSDLDYQAILQSAEAENDLDDDFSVPTSSQLMLRLPSAAYEKERRAQGRRIRKGMLKPADPKVREITLESEEEDERSEDDLSPPVQSAGSESGDLEDDIFDEDEDEKEADVEDKDDKTNDGRDDNGTESIRLAEPRLPRLENDDSDDSEYVDEGDDVE